MVQRKYPFDRYKWNKTAVSGKNKKLDRTGGHTKMGELIARAVYEGVKKAVYKQNKITANRTIFQRLNERKISLFEIAISVIKERGINISPYRLTGEIEKALLDDKVNGFMESALSFADDFNRKLISDYSFFNESALSAAGHIAGEDIAELIDYIADKNLANMISSLMILDIPKANIDIQIKDYINQLLTFKRERLIDKLRADLKAAEQKKDYATARELTAEIENLIARRGD